MTDCQRAHIATLVFRPVIAAALMALAVSVATLFPPVLPAAHAQARTDSLDAVIADYESYLLETSPSARAQAEGRPADAWPDVSRDTVQANARTARALTARLDAIDSDRAIDIAILRHILQDDISSAEHDLARIPFTGDSGFHSAPVFAASRARLMTLERAEAYITRLEDTPRYFAENISNMRRGMATGWTAHADPLATMRDQISEQIMAAPEESSLYAPLLALPDTIPGPDRLRLQREGRAAVTQVIAAYRDLLRFLDEDYVPVARPAPGLASLRHGRAVYIDRVEHHTAGAGLSPEEIHEIGLSEVARIRAEMELILDDVAFDGTLEEFIEFLRTDPRFYARSAEDLMEKASTIAKRLDAILPTYFGHLPRLPYGVSPVPAAIAPGYTTGRYAQGDPEAGRSGTYLVNTYRLDQRPLYELPALTAHEAVPGHHLQIALAQEMTGVPDYRREYYATAFGEGWGLYAERLAGEAGIYQTPYERFGALSYEMWRACRLVSDTGLHWYGWSRAQAEVCFIENTALSPLNIETEVTRYIGWPAQAVAYKTGELTIMRLRAEAETALGADFDLRAFHDHLLAEGSMPLSALSARMRQWISDQQAGSQGGETSPQSP